MKGSKFDVILLIFGCLHFMLKAPSNCSCFLQFMWCSVIVLLLRICLILCSSFLLCWLMICVLMVLLLDKRHVKQEDNVVVVKPIIAYANCHV